LTLYVRSTTCRRRLSTSLTSACRTIACCSGQHRCLAHRRSTSSQFVEPGDRSTLTSSTLTFRCHLCAMSERGKGWTATRWCSYMTTPSHSCWIDRYQPTPKLVADARPMRGLMMTAGEPSDWFVQKNARLGVQDRCRIAADRQYKLGVNNVDSTLTYCVRRSLRSGQLASLLTNSIRVSCGSHSTGCLDVVVLLQLTSTRLSYTSFSTTRLPLSMMLLLMEVSRPSHVLQPAASSGCSHQSHRRM